MKDSIKGKVPIILVVIATVMLAGVAVFTAVKLYQLKGKPAEPSIPEVEPEPEREVAKPALQACGSLRFSVKAATLTATSTPKSTPTSTLTPTPTLRSSPTPTTSKITRISPTPTEVTLPEVGVELPTLFGVGAGILLITFALILAI